MNNHNERDKIPAYSELFVEVLDALKALGGSGKPLEVCHLIADKLQLSDIALEVTKKDGTQLFSNRVHWARLYLVRSRYIDSSKRGVWSLTNIGREVELDDRIVRLIITNAQSQPKLTMDRSTREDVMDSAESQEIDENDHHGRVLEILCSMSPNSFERLCQRLLRESGFEQVVVTGRSGDEGIDGYGVLQLNTFVSFRVLFQCKRYRKTIGSPLIRDFRGAIMGRADKGIMITTGSFSQSARREAIRDGAPAIELVDGNTLIKLFESLEFGLAPRQVYEIDHDFFASFEDLPD